MACGSIIGSGHYFWQGAVEKGDTEFECKQLEGGQNFNAQLQRGGAKSECAIIEGGAHFECERFRNSVAPPSVNNDHSLKNSKTTSKGVKLVHKKLQKLGRV